jgi:hypothetical protein
MQSRRVFVVASLLLLPAQGIAQAGAAFIGEWQGDVPGIGAAKLIITAVRPNGQVEGRMEFALKSFVSTFGDKADSVKSINHWVISGSALTIESALGGQYDLSRNGNRLSGTYARGTTYRVAVTFTKS